MVSSLNDRRKNKVVVVAEFSASWPVHAVMNSGDSGGKLMQYGKVRESALLNVLIGDYMTINDAQFFIRQAKINTLGLA